MKTGEGVVEMLRLVCSEKDLRLVLVEAMSFSLFSRLDDDGTVDCIFHYVECCIQCVLHILF